MEIDEKRRTLTLRKHCPNKLPLSEVFLLFVLFEVRKLK